MINRAGLGKAPEQGATPRLPNTAVRGTQDAGRDGSRWNLPRLLHTTDTEPASPKHNTHRRRCKAEMMSCHAAVHGSLISLPSLLVYTVVSSKGAAQAGPGSPEPGPGPEPEPEPRPLFHVAHRGIGKARSTYLHCTTLHHAQYCTSPGTYRCNDWRDRNGPDPCPLWPWRRDVTQRNGQCLARLKRPVQRPTTCDLRREQAARSGPASCRQSTPRHDPRAHTHNHTSTQHQPRHRATIT